MGRKLGGSAGKDVGTSENMLLLVTDAVPGMDVGAVVGGVFEVERGTEMLARSWLHRYQIWAAVVMIH